MNNPLNLSFILKNI